VGVDPFKDIPRFQRLQKSQTKKHLHASLNDGLEYHLGNQAPVSLGLEDHLEHLVKLVITLLGIFAEYCSGLLAEFFALVELTLHIINLYSGPIYKFY